MTQVRPTNTQPPARHAPDLGRILQEVAPPFVLRPREKSRSQVKSSSAAEDSSDEKKHAAEAERVAALAAAFSNNNDDDGGTGGGSGHHHAEDEIALCAPPQPDPVPSDIPQVPVIVAPPPTQGTTASSEEDEIAAELATLGEDPGIFELTFPGGAQLAVAIEGRGRGLSFFLSTDNEPLGKKLKLKKKELATSLERRIGRTLNLIVL